MWNIDMMLRDFPLIRFEFTAQLSISMEARKIVAHKY